MTEPRQEAERLMRDYEIGAVEYDQLTDALAAAIDVVNQENSEHTSDCWDVSTQWLHEALSSLREYQQ